MIVAVLAIHLVQYLPRRTQNNVVTVNIVHIGLAGDAMPSDIDTESSKNIM
jgi:hypothetical protein